MEESAPRREDGVGVGSEERVVVVAASEVKTRSGVGWGWGVVVYFPAASPSRVRRESIKHKHTRTIRPYICSRGV